MRFDGFTKLYDLWYLLYAPHGVNIPSWSSLGSGEDSTSDIGSTQCFDFLKSRLEECVRNVTNTHRTCIQPQPTPLPKRVLSVRPQDIRICDMDGEFGRYCALSYRWGPPEHVFKTTRANLSQMMQHIDWYVLPRLIQDAIAVVRELDVQYLWIDALCIIQEDEADWLSESTKMGQYYSNAFLTIAASSSAGVGMPFLGPRVRPDETSPSSSPRSEFEFCNTDGITTIIIGRQVPDYGGITLTGTTLLATRGWTWQENALSVRIAHFTCSEIIWECRSCQQFENGAVLRSSDTSLAYRFAAAFQGQADKNQSQLEYYWKSLVSEFSGRQLTYESDRLAALSGVAAEIQKSMILAPASTSIDSQYLVGLWRQWLHSDLMWSTHWFDCNFPPVVSRASNLPSWSWLSLSGPVSFEYSLLELISLRKTRPPLLNIKHVACEPLRESNPFGDIQAGASITLMGYLFPAALRSSNTRQPFSYKLIFDGFNGTLHADTVLEEIDLIGLDGATLGRTVRRRIAPTHSSGKPDVLDVTVYCLFIVGGCYKSNINSSWLTYTQQGSFYLVLGPSSSSSSSSSQASGQIPMAKNVFTRVGSFQSFDRKRPKMAKLEEIILV